METHKPKQEEQQEIQTADPPGAGENSELSEDNEPLGTPLLEDSVTVPSVRTAHKRLCPESPAPFPELTDKFQLAVTFMVFLTYNLH